MPASLVALYSAQIEGVRAEEKLHEVEVIMVANADKKSDRDRVMMDWRKQANKGAQVKRQRSNGPIPGLGA